MRTATVLRVFVASVIAALAPAAHAADGDRPVFGMGTMATIGGLFGPPDKRGLVDPELFFRYVELAEESEAVARQIIMQVRDATERAIEEYQQSLSEMTGEVAMFEAALPIAKKQGEAITNAFAELELLVPEGQERAWEAFLTHQFRRGFSTW